MKVLHTGDLHIGSYPGPEKNGVNERFLDVRRSLDCIEKGAREEQPDLIIVAGDIFHQARVWSDRGLREQREAIRFFERLSKICPVVVMRGTPNHDSEEQFKTLKAVCSSTDIRIITEPGVISIKARDGHWVEVACLPGFDRGFFRAQHPGLSAEEENQVFTKAIEDLIFGLRAQCAPLRPCILVGHYTIAGCNMESGQTAFFSKFEPVVYPDALRTAAFDLNCFGHIHRPQALEGCGNTYYCGAIMPMNFNDEGQERGYWIHNVEKNYVESEFHKIPGREFRTIRLKDDDVRVITEQGPGCMVFEDTRDKIVRVLYDCTDEHNKAFNHTELANWLYEQGAFWVQEITPQNITIAVDKRSLEADGTPEGNLAAYMDQKAGEMEEAVKARIMDRARPIIAEAAEAADKDRRTGLFVPVEIEVKNYRNYAEEKFSFEDISFCTINGENGAGKSSLFMDAICDCLFEETREGDLTGWIRNDEEARSGSIKFTFRLGEDTYRVTRTRQKSGKATLNISQLVDGEWVNRSKEKFRDTQEEIVNIIGMDSLTLKACALIMQDQYGLFLQADKETRMSILGSILGLGIYGDMESLAAQKATEANRAARSKQDRIESAEAGLPDVGELKAQIEQEEEKKAQDTEIWKGMSNAVTLLKADLAMKDQALERCDKLGEQVGLAKTRLTLREKAIREQEETIRRCEKTLSDEPTVAYGVERRKELLEQEKVLIQAKAQYDSLCDRRTELMAEYDKYFKEFESKTDRAVAVDFEIHELLPAIQRKEELEKSHQEYEKLDSEVRETGADLEEQYKKLSDQYDSACLEKSGRKNEWEAKIDRLTTRIEFLQGKTDMLKESGCPNPETASCKFLTDAKQAEAELPKVERELAEAKAAYSADMEAMDKVAGDAFMELTPVADAMDRLDALKRDRDKLEPEEKAYRELAAQEARYELLRETWETLSKERIELQNRCEESNARIYELAEKIKQVSEANRDYYALQKELDGTLVWVEKEKQIPVARKEKETAEKRKEELLEEHEALKQEVSELNNELIAETEKAKGCQDLKNRISSGERDMARMQEQIQDHAARIGRLEKEIEDAGERMEEIEVLRERLSKDAEQAADYEYLKKAFSQDGIPHNIIRSIIPVFEATATNILGQMSGGKMSVEFLTEKVLKSNSKKEVTALEIIINDADTGRLPYMSRSGGERVKAALSVILALSEIKSSKAGVQLGFLFIDEPPFLDAQGVQAYCDALEAIQARYADLKVMAITHDPAMKARFPQSVDVVKTPEGSKVIF